MLEEDFLLLLIDLASRLSFYLKFFASREARTNQNKRNKKNYRKLRVREGDDEHAHIVCAANLNGVVGQSICYRVQIVVGGHESLVNPFSHLCMRSE